MPKPEAITKIRQLADWTYLGQSITDINQLPEGAYGFIYFIQHIVTGNWYIGKKNFYSERNIRLGKKALAAREDKRSSKKKKVVTESDWKTYCGSEPTLLKDIDRYGPASFRKEIIRICFTKTALTYEEVRQQILHGCLEAENCYNKNILGKFFRQKTSTT